MAYNPSSDFVGLWRAISGGVEKAQMPGLDFVVSAMARAGLMRVSTSATPPTVNQASTAWFQPAGQSFAAEGTLFLWDPSLQVYVPATPELFHGGDNSSGGGGGGDGGGGSDMVIISGTAPSNPSTGAEWWDGSVLRVFDGTAWKLVGPGGAAGPVPTTTKAFSITQTTNITLTLNSWQIVPFTTTPSLDGFVGWNATNHEFKPTRAGTYMFLTKVFMGTGTAGGMLQLALFKNDQGVVNNSTEYVQVAEVYSPNPVNTWLGSTGIAVMNGSTDFVRLWAFNGDGSTDPNFYGGNIPNFEAYLLP